MISAYLLPGLSASFFIVLPIFCRYPTVFRRPSHGLLTSVPRSSAVRPGIFRRPSHDDNLYGAAPPFSYWQDRP